MLERLPFRSIGDDLLQALDKQRSQSNTSLLQLFASLPRGCNGVGRIDHSACFHGRRLIALRDLARARGRREVTIGEGFGRSNGSPACRSAFADDTLQAVRGFTSQKSELGIHDDPAPCLLRTFPQLHGESWD